MQRYEKDFDIKIPSWYLRLPQKELNLFSDVGLAINRMKPQVKQKKMKKML